jgi:hypothetical protein
MSDGDGHDATEGKKAKVRILGAGFTLLSWDGTAVERNREDYRGGSVWMCVFVYNECALGLEILPSLIALKTKGLYGSLLTELSSSGFVVLYTLVSEG